MAAAVRALATFAACAALLGAAPGRARDLSGDGRLALRTTLKSTLLVSRFPDDPALYPERVGADALFRLRLDASAKPSDAVTAAAAWETRLHATAPSGAATGGFLPPDAAPPFRVRALDEPLATADGLAWRHELDRAFVAWRPGPSELTAGRQAIGWGRGVLFGAVDLFAPFSPLEADRAWRRGVDALRADVRLGERLSVDAAAALGHDADPDASIFAARIRGYTGELDGELLVGRRARDLVVGLASSAAVGDAEGHVELALFRTPSPVKDPLLGDDRLVAKAVLGASYRFPLGSGLPVFAEFARRHRVTYRPSLPAVVEAVLHVPTRTATPVVAMVLSTALENYRWTSLAAAGVALALAGNVLVLRPGRRPPPGGPRSG